MSTACLALVIKCHLDMITKCLRSRCCETRVSSDSSPSVWQLVWCWRLCWSVLSLAGCAQTWCSTNTPTWERPSMFSSTRLLISCQAPECSGSHCRCMLRRALSSAFCWPDIQASHCADINSAISTLGTLYFTVSGNISHLHMDVMSLACSPKT